MNLTEGMNLVDRLLAIDAKQITEKETVKIEIKRLSKLTGEPFFVTVQEIDGERYQELQMRLLNKKGKADFTKAYDTNLLVAVEGIIEPNLADEKLQKHFGAATPKELASKLFQAGDLIKISDVIAKLNGFGEEEEEEIKN